MAKKKEINSYKAIIFDLDGTLIDSLPYHFTSFNETLKSLGVEADKKYLWKIIGMPTESIFLHYKKKYKLKESIKSMKEKRRAYYYRLIHGKELLFPGVVHTLTNLKKQYKLAIATGSSRVTMNHMTNKKFRELFDEIITINDTKLGKPFPDPLLLACKRLKVNTRDCLMIGDSIYDAIAAKRAKMDFIGAVTGFSTGSELKKLGALKVIKTIKELGKILKTC